LSATQNVSGNGPVIASTSNPDNLIHMYVHLHNGPYMFQMHQ
jgi:hypothetical protein